MKSGELAARLDVSDSLIRKWATDYEEFLSPQGAGLQKGEPREFNLDDQLMMATIAHLRNEGLKHAEIDDQIREGWRVEFVPPPPDPEVEDARRKVSMVPVDRLERALDQIVTLEKTIDRLLGERDEAIQKYDEANAEHKRLLREIGQMEGRIEQIPLLEAKIEELKEALAKKGDIVFQSFSLPEVEELRRQLEEAKKRSGLFGWLRRD